MVRNMCTLDRVIRAGLAFVIVAVIPVTATGWPVWVFYGIAIYLAVTSWLGTCPAYRPFHIDTRKKPRDGGTPAAGA